MTDEITLEEISALGINGNFAVLKDVVNSKAKKNGDAEQKFKVADAVEQTEAINKKQLEATVAGINAEIAEIETELTTKADKIETEAALATKADKTYVDTNLALKANIADVGASLALKADKTYVDSNLAPKANTSDVDASLALKADKTYVDSNLVTKADLNGNISQIFNVAAGTESTQAINKGQLDSVIGLINNDITDIEESIQSLASNTAFAMNSGNVDANGNAEILFIQGSGTVVEQVIPAMSATPQNSCTISTYNNQTGYGISCWGGDGYTYQRTFGVESTTLTYDTAINKTGSAVFYWTSTGDGYGNLTKNPTLTITYNDGTTQTELLYNGSAPFGDYQYNLTIAKSIKSLAFNSDFTTDQGSAKVGLFRLYITVSVSTATTVYSKVGNNYPNLTLTYADGTQESLNFLQSITNFSSNGIYTILKEKGSNPVAVLTTKITQGKTFPTNPIDGDYHCLISCGLQTFKRVSGAWTEIQYVILGTATINGSVIMAVTTKPYNQNGYDFNMQTTKAYIIETYKNGTSWYRKWSDGWIEQGGYAGGYSNTLLTVNLLLPYSDSNYCLTFGSIGTNPSGMPYYYMGAYNLKSTTQFNTYIWDTVSDKYWYTCGYGL